MLSFGIADEESWESLSENFRMALMSALAVDEGAFALSSRRVVRVSSGVCSCGDGGSSAEFIAHE